MDAGRLIEAFTQVRAVPRARHGELLARLEHCVAEGHERYPRLAVEPARYVARLAALLDPRDEPLAALELLRAAPLWLTFACSIGDPRALDELERVHLSRVPAFLARIDPSPAFADEVLQQLRAALLLDEGDRAPGIASYSGRGELDGWLRVLAIRAAQRLRREQLRHAPAGDIDALPEQLGRHDPEREHLKARYQADYQTALQSALAALPVRERLFLRLHYVDGLNLDKIGRLYQLHRSTVARRLAEHRRRVLELTYATLRERLRLTDSELDSVLSLVRSQLGISVRELLG